MSESADARGGISRRRFIQGVGAGAVAVGVVAVAGQRRALAQSPSPAVDDPLASVDLNTVQETWAEPQVWRPVGTDPLSLNVVEDVNGLRFSYDGKTPGPTVRMGGDQTLYVRITNKLGPDQGTTPVGPYPDPVEGYPGPEGQMLATLQGDDVFGPGLNRIPTIPRQDWALGEHANGVHSAHVTNMHTHGLHVAPGMNDNGTSSDDIFLRIIPAGDALRISQSPGLYYRYQENRDEIVDNLADFEFRLGDVMAGLVGPDGQPIASGLPHPPGTYWYHPHSHGATQNQVASGMAGFLIIEGDVDALLNERIAGQADAAWDVKTGPYDYRERSMLIQRVFVAPAVNVSGSGEGSDPDQAEADPQKLKKQQNTISTFVNGDTDPDIITMRPGAIERWRVLNGSVDGAGFMRFAVLRGEFDTDDNNALMKIERGANPTAIPVTVNDYQPLSFTKDGTQHMVEKANIHVLSWDGITNVREDDSGGYYYKVESLAEVNDGQEPDLATFQDCYESDNIRLCYRRPNELAMADANRADVLFRAPALTDGQPQVYTLVSMPTQLNGTPENTSTIIARVVVSGDEVSAEEIEFSSLLDGLAVHPYEIPVQDDELLATEVERGARGILVEQAYRTRTIRYSGWGANGWPMVDANPEYVGANPEKYKLSYYSPPPEDSTAYSMPVTVNGQTQAVPVTGIKRYPAGELPTIVLPAGTRTMAIDGQKFYPTSDTTPKMLLDTSEEWAIFNESLDIYSVAPPDDSWTADQIAQYLELNPELVWYQFEYVDEPPDGAPTSPQPYFGKHAYSYAMTQAQVESVNASRAAAGGDPWTQRGQLQIIGRATDHPFHIHQNPFWLLRIEVPDANGEYVNILPEPRWSDTVAVPRNGGRVVFRSRFVDYSGEFVEHCHILLHEDNGMMQRLQVVDDAALADYQPAEAVATKGESPAQVNELYPQPTLAESWARSSEFADRNRTGQVYPGTDFILTVPTPPTE